MNPAVHLGALLLRPLSEDVVVFLVKTRFHLPELGLQFSGFVYEIFPNWIAPLQQSKAISQ